MANILLTKKCVRNCPYCFAKEQMENEPDDTLTWDNFIYIVDLHEKSQMMHLSLLGGEPTLHPKFNEFVAYSIDRGVKVNVFTSGIMSKAKLNEMKDLFSEFTNKQVSFVCNVNAPELGSKKENERLDDFLSNFGEYTNPGYNIYEADFDLGFIIEQINKYNLKRHIRIGLTHPIVGEKNIHLKKEDLKNMASNFMTFVDILEKENISAGFDCGMPMCLFSDGDIGRLYKLNKGRLKFGCGPAIDIGTDMQVWACFPLGEVERKSIFDFDSIQAIGDYYTDMHKRIRDGKGGIFKECIECIHFKNELCSGGCLTYLL
jgi:hypothetical protein